MSKIIEKLVKLELWFYKIIGTGIYEIIATKRQNRYMNLMYKNNPEGKENYKKKYMPKFSSITSIEELKEHKKRTYLKNVFNTVALLVGPLFLGPILVTGTTTVFTVIASALAANFFISAFYDNFLQRKKRIDINKEIKKLESNCRNQENDQQSNSEETQPTREQGIDQMLEPVLQQEMTNQPAQENTQTIEQQPAAPVIETQEIIEHQDEQLAEEELNEENEEILSSPIKVKYYPKKIEHKEQTPKKKVISVPKSENKKTYLEYKAIRLNEQKQAERNQHIQTRRDKVQRLLNTKEMPISPEKDKKVITENTTNEIPTIDLLQFYRDLREELKKEPEIIPLESTKKTQKVKVKKITRKR